MPVLLTSEQGFIQTAIKNQLNETAMDELTAMYVDLETQITAETKILTFEKLN